MSSCRKAWHDLRAKCGENSKIVGYTCINPTPCDRILHPILHPKLSVNTGHPMPWCRKCRRFSKTFFVEGRARRRSGISKTSDFFDTKYGCFASKVRMFASKKSDVLLLPERVVYIRAISHESFREHRHHVRKHIINKAFFILETWMSHGWSDSRIWNSRCRIMYLCSWLPDFSVITILPKRVCQNANFDAHSKVRQNG